MSVYPFYINAKAEGRKTPISGGSRRKDGSINTTIYQRANGGITTPFEIKQFTDIRNEKRVCITQVYYFNNLIAEHVTDY